METVHFKGTPCHTYGDIPAVGTKAPCFNLVTKDLADVTCRDFAGKRIVLNVFPSLDTPVCAMSVRRFNKMAAEVPDVAVICVSMDLPFALSRFCAAEGIDRVHVFSDYRELDFGMKYGFVIDSLRLLARGVVVVDRDDVVRYVEYVPEVTHEPDYEKALAVARELAK